MGASIIEQSIKVWENSEKIRGYCARHKYSAQDCSALMQFDRLRLGEAAGTLNGTIEEALAAIASSSELEKATFKKIGEKDPVGCESLFRLAEDEVYAEHIRSLYDKIKQRLQS